MLASGAEAMKPDLSVTRDRRLSSDQEVVQLPRAQTPRSPLTTDEAREVMNIARRIAAILLLEPSLNANYQAIKTAAYPWPSS
jgi:hypothetical protein